MYGSVGMAVIGAAEDRRAIARGDDELRDMNERGVEGDWTITWDVAADEADVEGMITELLESAGAEERDVRTEDFDGGSWTITADVDEEDRLEDFMLLRDMEREAGAGNCTMTADADEERTDDLELERLEDVEGGS
jgi:hypothetical protein